MITVENRFIINRGFWWFASNFFSVGRTQAYIELISDPLPTIFHKIVCLLNELRSKKHIQAQQLDSMMPKLEKVSLGYLYFIPKPQKVVCSFFPLDSKDVCAILFVRKEHHYDPLSHL